MFLFCIFDVAMFSNSKSIYISFFLPLVPCVVNFSSSSIFCFEMFYAFTSNVCVWMWIQFRWTSLIKWWIFDTIVCFAWNINEMYFGAIVIWDLGGGGRGANERTRVEIQLAKSRKKLSRLFFGANCKGGE